jgi:hypothetical protein
MSLQAQRAVRPPVLPATATHADAALGLSPSAARRRSGAAPPDTRDGAPPSAGAEAPRHTGTRACGSQPRCRCLRPSSMLHLGRCSSEHVAATLLDPRPARLLVATPARRTSPAVDGGSGGPRPAHAPLTTMDFLVPIYRNRLTSLQQHRKTMGKPYPFGSFKFDPLTLQ